LLNCDGSYVYQYAKAHNWKRPGDHAAGEPVSDEIAAMVSVLRDPTTGRGEAVALMERAGALIAADVLTSGDGRAGRRVDMLGKLVAHVNNLRGDAAPAKDSDAAGPADHFPDANDLIEEIARRLEAAGDEWLDPRVLAAVAATVP